jgi:hypothetical protein
MKKCLELVILLGISLSAVLFAASKNLVEGVVLDENGKPLSGAVLRFSRTEHQEEGIRIVPIITPRVVGAIGGTEPAGDYLKETHIIKADKDEKFAGFTRLRSGETKVMQRSPE